MTAGEWRRKSDAICMQLQHSSLLAKARTILAYTCFRQEPDVMPLLTELVQGEEDGVYDRLFALPRCKGKSIIWHQWHPHQAAPLVTGAYGILEPDASWPTLTPNHLSEPAVLLIPAVGCDRHGYRIGYGAGFYDRLLSQPAWSTVTTIGIIFEFAYLEQLPRDPWDQPLAGVCTEKELVCFK